MRLITSHETITKYLEKGYYLWLPTNCGLKFGEMYIMNGQDILGVSEFQAHERLMSITEYKAFLNKANNNEEVKLSIKDFKRLMANIEAKEKRLENKALKQEVHEAIEYLKGWQEGDTITITADFVNNVETIAQYLESLKK